MTNAGAPSPHLFIAGTGRAGTSFLVRLLADLGLETHLQRQGDGQWFEGANAGFEDLPLPGQHAALPYVVKSPWLYEVIDDVLADPNIKIDGVIIPMRRLADAAASRIVVERQHIHRTAPWLATMPTPWSTWGAAPGGVVYSLDALDQARLLAVGLHTLIERLVEAEIPITFLDFPRLATDPAYLFRHLQPHLPAGATQATVSAALLRLADPAKIRANAERTPCHDNPLETAALKRELNAIRTQLALSRQETDLYRTSISWRVTAPLRALARMLGGKT